ncbi:MAG: AAA family ATPase [Ruminococcus sp.]|uniref:ATP-dependent nuclease n=1 Tax=Ruminococcus sp. TaxID=41978 RepID=UPI0025DD388A|nr:AAA family ATPase [Ruminococcus sp.]MBR0530839.1 AAA family ATPase [Ruminococcus sp.]
MSKEILIKNTKGIKELKFDFPARTGVYLIVGPNGIGKTTLLACMDRICNPYAFARNFTHSKYISGYDEYSGSTITYNVDNTCVHFHKRKHKWAATPKKDNAELLKQFGFSDSIFIKADSKRIDVTQDEIQKGITQAADSFLIKTLNTIFSTDKYSNLKKLKITHGRGKPSSIFNVIKDGNNYYTEKRFSTGEIAILRLVESISDASPNTLILLDEAEMALHPKVQTNLLKYLTDIAEKKHLTIFISTHSPTMIKNTSPNNILLLEEEGDNGETIVCNPCYPAHALGGVDYEEAKIYDYIFFVEDVMARDYLKQIVKRYKALESKHSTAEVSIVPVGGYYETSKMAVDTNNQLFRSSKVFSLVDADAFEDIDNKPKFDSLLKKHKNIIKQLPITPEVFFISELAKMTPQVCTHFRAEMHCELRNVLSSQDYTKCNSQSERQLAKDRFTVVINKCCESTGDDEKIVTDRIIKLIIDQITDGEIKHFMGPIFNSKQKI